MAYIEDLTLQNSAGETKSNYSLIADLATAIARANRNVQLLHPTEEDLEIDAKDGDELYFNVYDQSVILNLPDVSTKAGVCVYARITTDGDGTVTIVPNADGENSIIDVMGNQVLTVQGDYVELVSLGNGTWLRKSYFID